MAVHNVKPEACTGVGARENDSESLKNESLKVTKLLCSTYGPGRTEVFF